MRVGDRVVVVNPDAHFHQRVGIVRRIPATALGDAVHVELYDERGRLEGRRFVFARHELMKQGGESDGSGAGEAD